jgi:hypothetical protein
MFFIASHQNRCGRVCGGIPNLKTEPGARVRARFDRASRARLRSIRSIPCAEELASAKV